MNRKKCKTCKISKWIGKITIIVAILIFAILFMWHKFYSSRIINTKTTTENKNIKTQDELYAEYFTLRKHKVNPYNINFTLKQENICDGKTYLIIIVPSKVENEQQRHAVRTTWTRSSDGTVKHVFLLGKSINTTLNTKIVQENRVFKDIVQGDFIDSYFNLTLKILMGLKWTNINCYNASFILKADDDTYVNIAYLQHILKTNTSVDYRGLILGKINTDGKVRRTGLWKVQINAYPFPHYPKYMFGNTYVLSVNLANRLVKASEYMPYIPIEDAYITGILAKSIRAVHQHVNGFTFWYDALPKACDLITKRRISVTKVSPLMMGFIWKKSSSKYPNC